MRRRWAVGLAAGMAVLASGAAVGFTALRADPAVHATPSLHAVPMPASGDLARLQLEPVGGRFDTPVDVVAVPPDPGDHAESLVVLEKSGRAWLLRDGVRQPQPYLDLAGQVGEGLEQGLLGLAYAPDHVTSGLTYVFRTDSGNGDVVVEEYAVAADRSRLDPATRREVLRVPQPYDNHNGGQLRFDAAGMLLVGLGDGGGENDPDQRAQDLGQLHGKILRIDPRAAGAAPYAIPSDNPYVDTPGARPEVWAYGLRNPWRFTFAPDGTLVIGDVGQYRMEELDLVAPDVYRRGANFGWSAYEGDRLLGAGHPVRGPGQLVRPALEYAHDERRCSVTSGPVYTGSAIPALRGAYLFGDFCSGEVFATWRAADGLLSQPVELAVTNGQGTLALASFGVDARGELLLVDVSGTVFRLLPPG